MKIYSKPCGAYQTNCYIVLKNGAEIIIDPGQDSFEFVTKICKNPIAIINTHGHMDHIFDDFSLKNFFNIDVYIHKDDNFMLKDDVFFANYKTFDDAICVGGDKFEDTWLKIGEFDVEFMHFAGHTPGCCMVRIDDIIFSGDFLFKSSIGRYDFAYSNKEDMIKSLQKCLKIEKNFKLYPGHGDATTLKAEQENLPSWLRYLNR
ncbi:MAG: MBL fold metallo-hydrolase [Campylobacter sp.]